MTLCEDHGLATVEPEQRAVLAFADELAERPDLLAGLEHAVRDRVISSLIVLPGGWSPEQVSSRIELLLSGLGLDEDTASPDVLVVTGPVAESDEKAIAARCRAIYGHTVVGPQLSGLPRLDAAQIAADGTDVEDPTGNPASVPHLDLEVLREADERPHVRSFDVFDTLLARRCGSPLTIFELVGERVGMPEFAALRRRAEQNLLAGTYTFDDIYDELGRLAEIDSSALADLQRTELAIEFEQAIPIAENLAQVRDGELLVSDMYLPTPTIRDLLASIGLQRRVGLIVSNHGKAKGTIWPQLLKRFQIERHTGDNRHADVDGAGQFGVHTTLSTAHAPNAVEHFLSKQGLVHLSGLSRELRLSTWTDEPLIRSLQVIQASLNIPMLALASILLLRLSERERRRHILFSSRDCYQWVPMFERIAELASAEVSAEYFYTSRVTRTKPSNSYLEYAASRLTPDSIVVDICGSGWSLAYLVHALELQSMPTFILHLTSFGDHYARIGAMPDSCDFSFIVGRKAPNVDNVMFEMSNFADHGMVTDVEMVLGEPLPVFAEDDRTTLEMRAVEAQLDVARRAPQLFGPDVVEELNGLSDDVLTKLFGDLYRVMSSQAAAFSIYMPSFLAENQRVNASIETLRPQTAAAPPIAL